MHKIIFYRDKNNREPVLAYRKKHPPERLSKPSETGQIIKKGTAPMNDLILSPQGQSWDDVKKDLFTEQERAESAVRVGLMVELTKARNEQGLTQKRLEELSGVAQPVIARMESGVTSPQLETVLRVLSALGKTLYIGDLNEINRERV